MFAGRCHGNGVRSGSRVCRTLEEVARRVAGRAVNCCRTVKQLLGAKLGIVRNAVNGVQSVVDFGLIRGQRIGIVDPVIC